MPLNLTSAREKALLRYIMLMVILDDNGASFGRVAYVVRDLFPVVVPVSVACISSTHKPGPNTSLDPS